MYDVRYSILSANSNVFPFQFDAKQKEKKGAKRICTGIDF